MIMSENGVEEGVGGRVRLRELSSAPESAEAYVDRMMALSLDQAELPELAEWCHFSRV